MIRSPKIRILLRVAVGVTSGLFVSWLWVLIIPAIYALYEGVIAGGLAVQRADIEQRLDDTKNADAPVEQAERLGYGCSYFFMASGTFYLTMLVFAVGTRLVRGLVDR